MTIRGGGHPKQAMVLKPVSRMGPPPRSFAADAHDCIMVRSLRTYRIQGCGEMIRARWQSSPLIIVPTTTSVAACSGLSRRGLETTERAARAERRPTLTGPVRVGLNTCVVGAKKRDSKSNKETGMEEVESGVKYMLDFKSPRVAACTLALSPIRDTLIEGFSHFVTSMTAPIASGWSGCRVGLAPTGKRRLVTAHTQSRHRNRSHTGKPRFVQSSSQSVQIVLA